MLNRMPSGTYESPIVSYLRILGFMGLLVVLVGILGSLVSCGYNDQHRQAHMNSFHATEAANAQQRSNR